MPNNLDAHNHRLVKIAQKAYDNTFNLSDYTGMSRSVDAISAELEAENDALTARCERLATAYLNAETTLVEWVTNDDHVAARIGAAFRKHLLDDDLPGDALEGGEG